MTDETVEHPLDKVMFTAAVLVYILVLGLLMYVPALLARIYNWRYVRSFEAIASRRAQRNAM